MISLKVFKYFIFLIFAKTQNFLLNLHKFTQPRSKNLGLLGTSQKEQIVGYVLFVTDPATNNSIHLLILFQYMSVDTEKEPHNKLSLLLSEKIDPIGRCYPHSLEYKVEKCYVRIWSFLNRLFKVSL